MSEPRIPEPGMPEPPLHERVAEVWREALRLDRLAEDDDFFEAGGHSLLAMRVASRLRDELDCDLPRRAIFEHRTVAALAAEIERRGAGA